MKFDVGVEFSKILFGDDFTKEIVSRVINITRAKQFGDDFSRGRFLQHSTDVP